MTTSSHPGAIAGGDKHLVFVIDLLLKNRPFDSSIYVQCLDAILAFGLSFLMQSGDNKLTVLGSNSTATCVLYRDPPPPTAENQPDQSIKLVVRGQQCEQFATVTCAFRANFLRWIEQCLSSSSSSSNSVTSEVSNNRNGSSRFTNNPTTTTNSSSLLPGALAQGLCIINRYRYEYAKSRMIIFSLGSDKGDQSYTTQYMKLINCFFAGQKMDVIFDACSVALNRENEETATVSAQMEERFAASILQQGCDLTGGRYIRVHKVSTLLEHLLWCLTPSAEERSRLVLPPKLRISPPAACFCHRKIIQTGYVCSVCVSIYCQYLPFCSTCQSNVFVNTLKQIASLKNPDRPSGSTGGTVPTRMPQLSSSASSSSSSAVATTNAASTSS